MTRILIAGGGTGGHLFPGIAVAQKIKSMRPDAEILFVGTERGIEARAVPKANFKLALLDIRALRGKGLWGFLRGLLQLPISLVQAFKCIQRFRPDVAVSVGGYAAGPAVLAARLCGIYVIVMEQNTIPGITNRILALLAHRVAAAMPTPYFNPKKCIVLGNPVREDILPLHNKPFYQHTPSHLLVFGGSQGARAINQLFVGMAQQGFKPCFTLTHQTGMSEYEKVKEAYAQTAWHQHVTVVPFIENMAEAYDAADLVVCRSGASSIAELTVAAKPAIFIPFPQAADDHQTANAKTLEAVGAALCFAQHTLTPDILYQHIASLLQNQERLKAMAHAARQAALPQATLDIAQLILQQKG